MTYPLRLPIIFFITGVFFSKTCNLASHNIGSILLLLSALLLVAAIFLCKTKIAFYYMICLFFLCLGSLRYYSFTYNENPPVTKHINDGDKVLIYGAVNNYPFIKNTAYGSYRYINMDAFKLIKGEEEYDVRGRVGIRLFNLRNSPEMGDKLLIGGTVSSWEKGGKRFVLLNCREYDVYLKTGYRHSFINVLKKKVFVVRREAGIILKKSLTGDPLAITESLVLGLRSSIDDEVKTLFIKTGTMHILAVSGLHVAIVGAIILFLLRSLRCPDRIAYVTAIILLWLFSILTGSRPSSLRAALMATFMLAGLIVNRKIDITDSLLFSAFFIIFFIPADLFSPSFILSYTAVLSIIFLNPVLTAWAGLTSCADKSQIFHRVKVYFLNTFTISTSVFIGMAPLIAFYFKIITPISILSNYLAIPFLLINTVTGFLIVAIGVSSKLSSLTYVLGVILSRLTYCYLGMMNFLSKAPLANINITVVSVSSVYLYYLVLVCFLLCFNKRKITKI